MNIFDLSGRIKAIIEKKFPNPDYLLSKDSLNLRIEVYHFSGPIMRVSNSSNNKYGDLIGYVQLVRMDHTSESGPFPVSSYMGVNVVSCSREYDEIFKGVGCKISDELYVHETKPVMFVKW